VTTATTNYVAADATDSVTDLLLGIGDGDSAAWDKVLGRYGKVVSRTVRSFRLQEADALDAMQMTWVRLAENADRVQFPERLGGWLVTTARRECMRILRQARFGPNFTDMVSETVSELSRGPEQRVIDAHITWTLRKLIDELSPRQQLLIRMLFTEDHHSYAEVAHITGIPLGGIGPTRARALQQLRDKLDQHKMGTGA
jgi:RNA polymerase sigma factor (sigma-70 family)